MKTKAFTLVELLVVIAIIAVLCGILFPVFATVRQKANAAKCATNLMELGVAVSMYNSEYDMRMIPYISYSKKIKKVAEEEAMDAPVTRIGVYEVSGAYAWSTLLYPYVKNRKTYKCPASMYDEGQEIEPETLTSTYNLGYAINTNITGAVASGSNLSVRTPLVQMLKRQANAYLIADGAAGGFFGTVPNGSAFDSFTYIPGSYETKDEAVAAGIDEEIADDTTARHTGMYINILYLDGHTNNVSGSHVLNEIKKTVSGTNSPELNGN